MADWEVLVAGGGEGYFNAGNKPTGRRRLRHHCTVYGFLLCLGPSSLATLYHDLLGREAPHAWCDIPVLLGIALVTGATGLALRRLRLQKS